MSDGHCEFMIPAHSTSPVSVPDMPCFRPLDRDGKCPLHGAPKSEVDGRIAELEHLLKSERRICAGYRAAHLKSLSHCDMMREELRELREKLKGSDGLRNFLRRDISMVGEQLKVSETHRDELAAELSSEKEERKLITRKYAEAMSELEDLRALAPPAVSGAILEGLQVEVRRLWETVETHTRELRLELERERLRAGG